MLAVRENKPLRPTVSSSPSLAELAHRLEGQYVNGDKDKGVDLIARNGKLLSTPREGGSRAELPE